ncbi:pyranose dehydrogenase [Mycena rebaudengoi]|nr:pyranose dehydrogenase [Mycena rebaudengoi]
MWAPSFVPMASLLALLLLSTSICNARIFTSPEQVSRLDAYDYVIIGAGVGGSVLANRLTEDRSTSVLLLEAGASDKALAIEVPGLQPGAGTIYTWNYSTIPQPSLDNRSIPAPRGHVLGGSSSTNGMFYTRGSSADYDRWAKVTGDKGWKWDNMQRYFKKSEIMTVPVDHHNTTGQFDPKLHGKNGPLGVTVGGFSQDIDALVMGRVDNTQFPFIEDYQDGSPIGLGWVQTTIRNGTRANAATAFLDTAAGRPNLDVVINTRVLRVVYGSSKKIPAVELQREGGLGNILRAQAKKEVLLCAGSFNTPQILLNSGIGDKQALLALNITPIHDLPSVGKNLSEHPAVPTFWNTKSPNLGDTTAAFNAALAEWNATHTGRLSMTSTNTVGWFRMNESDPVVRSLLKTHGDPAPGPNSPHFEIIPTINGGDPISRFADTPFVLFPVLLTGQSRGSVSLDPADRFGSPLIDYNFYSAPQDLEIMRQAVRTSIEFVDTPEWQNFLNGPATPEFAAVVDVIQSGRDDGNAAIDAHIRSTTTIAFHPIGTCAMSPKGAAWGVVDPDFRVKGLSGLRVIDASIMPFVPAAHTQAPTYAIAERAADIIKGSAN